MLSVLGISQTLAELPLARLHSIFPSGGKTGTSFEVSVSGADLDDASRLMFSSPGIIAGVVTNAAGATQPGRFSISIASNTPPGICDLRVIGRFGVTNPRAFAVGLVAEVTDAANNDSPGAAQRVSLNTTVNGRASVTAADYFQFDAQKGQRILIECLANQIDSKLEPVLMLLSSNGRELERSRRSGLIDFTAPAEGSYLLKLHDVLYRGGEEFPYRLSISTGPRIDYVFPPFGQAGVTNEYSIVGRNLPGGRRADGLSTDGKPLERLAVSMALLPASANVSGLRAPVTLKPASASLDLVDFPILPGLQIPPPLGSLAELSATVEAEPNNTAATAQRVPFPSEIAGQFAAPNDVDWFAFEVKKGDAFWVEVAGQRLGAPVDPFLLVQRVTKNDKGVEETTVAGEQYDSTTNLGGQEFNTTIGDGALRIEAKEDGQYRVMVRDQSSRSQADALRIYRLSLRREKPDFHLTAISLPPPTTEKDKREAKIWTPLLRHGESVLIKMVAFRQDGFDGEIAIKADGLPAGVTASKTVIPTDQSTAMLILTATDAVADWAGPIHIVGEALVGTSRLSREAMGGSVRWNVADYNNDRISSRLSRDFALATLVEESPLLVEPAETKIWETAQAAKLQIPLKLTRRGEFKEGVKLRVTGTGLADPLKEWDVDGKATATSLELDLAQAKLPNGVQQLYVMAYTKGKHRRVRPEEVKGIEEAIKTVEQTKSAEEKIVGEIQSKLKSAKDALAVATKENDDNKAGLEKASEADRSVAKAKFESSLTAKDAAQKLADEIAAMLKAPEQRKSEAIEAAKQLTAKIELREVTAAFCSPAIMVRVASAPITIAISPLLENLQPGSSVDLGISISRLYGFVDAVELLVAPLGEPKGFTAGKLVLGKDQTSGKISAKLPPDVKAGEFPLNLSASLKFNGKELKLDQRINLKVAEAARKTE